MPLAQYDDQDQETSLGDRDFFSTHPDLKELQEQDDIDKWENELSDVDDTPKTDTTELGPEQLGSAEEEVEADESDTETAQLPAEDDAEGFFNPDISGRKVGLSSFVRKRAVAFGLLGVGLFGGGAIMFAVIAGPLQFLHIAKLLQQFHFRVDEDTSDNRFGKMVRYLRDPSRPERTRMGVLGNKMADTFEAKMNKSGISSSYSGSFGKFNGYNIDLSTYEGGRFNGAPNSKLVEHFKAKYDIDLSLEGGTPRIPPAGTSFRGNRRLINGMLQQAGYSKVGAWVRSRIMIKRTGATLHPLKKLDSRILNSADDLARGVKDRFKRNIRSGVDPPDVDVTAADTGTDANGNPNPPNPDAVNGANGANDLLDAPVPDADVDAPAAKASGIKRGLAGAGTASAVIGITCAIKAVAENLDSVQHDLVVLPLIRMGVDAMAVGNQVMAGGEDVQLEQLGVLSEKFYSEEEGSWADAASIQYELGEEVTGPGIPSEAQTSNDKNPVSEFLNGVPGLGAICGAASSILGRIVTTVVDVASGPVSFVVGEVAGRYAITPLASKAIDYLSGAPINLDVVGAAYGNYINVGARLASNENMIAAGGRLLSTTESLALRDYRNQLLAEDQAQKSFAQRYFDVKDPRSLAGTFMSKQTRDPKHNMAMMFSSIPKSFASILDGGLFTQKVQAQSQEQDFDYGDGEYGFSYDDITNPAFDNPMQVNQDALDLVNGPNGDMYIERAKACFGVTISKLDFSIKRGGESVNKTTIPDDCANTDVNWTKIRWSIFDTSTMESYACMEDDETSCGNVSANTSVSSSSSSTTTALGLNNYRIPCTGLSTTPERRGGRGDNMDWTGIPDSGTIGTTTGGQPIKVYIREACDSANVKTVVIASSIHASENYGQPVSFELLFKKSNLPANMRVIAIPEINGSALNPSAVGRVNSRGVNLNRNYDYRWGEMSGADIDPNTTNYRGPAPASEPETQALTSFLTSLGSDISLFAVYHDNLDYVGSAGTTSPIIASKYRDYLRSGGVSMPLGNAGGVNIKQKGSLDGWVNQALGRPSLIVEMPSSVSGDGLSTHADALISLVRNGDI